MTEKQRIEKIREYSGVSLRKLSEEIGLKSPQTLYDILKGKHGISKDLATKIHSRYLNIDYTWICTGEGEMMIPTEQSNQVNVTNATNSTIAGGNIINNQPSLFTSVSEEENECADDMPMIPLYMYDSPNTDIFKYVQDNEVETLPRIRQLSNYDLGYRVIGDEMSPRVNAGDILCCTAYPKSAIRKILNGKIYLIDTINNGLVLRQLYKMESGYKAVALNPVFGEDFIEYEEVIRVYRIIGRLSGSM